VVEAVDQDDAGQRPVEAEAVTHHRHVEQFHNGARDLDAGRPATDHDERERAVRGMGSFPVRLLQAEQDVVTKMAGVIDRVEGMGVARRTQHPEEIDDSARGDDQRVEGNVVGAVITGGVVGLAGAGETDGPLLEIDPGHLAQAKMEVGGAADTGPNRIGHVGGVETSRRHLVEQRLERVVVVLINQRDVNGNPRQPAGCGQTAEAGTDDYDAMHWTMGKLRPFQSECRPIPSRSASRRACRHPTAK
jgi:hypothetical protein